jgi:Flp pilus assembly protein TadD
MGKFHEAREAYDEALKLDPNNSFLRTNYEQFREIYDRQNRRRDR